MRYLLLAWISIMHSLIACEQCRTASLSDLRTVYPDQPQRSKLPAAANLVPASEIDLVVHVRLIQLADDNGSNPAPLLGTSSQQQAILDHIDAVWNQAGIDIEFEIVPTLYRNSFANFGDASPRPTGDLFTIRTQARADGVLADDALTINMFMVNVVPGFSQTNANTANGLAAVNGNYFAQWVGPNLVTFDAGRDVAAEVIAHEIGHNLGLPHISEDFNLMQPGGSDNEGAVLNISQINTARASSYSQEIELDQGARSLALTIREGNTPLADVEVSIVNGDAAPITVITDAAGSIEVSNLNEDERTDANFDYTGILADG